MLLQNFDISLADPNYKLQIQQSLTVKPKNMFLNVSPRVGLDPIAIEKRLLADNAPTTVGESYDVEDSTSQDGKSNRPINVFFGGNMGTCESLTQTISNAASCRGFKAQVKRLDEATNNLKRDEPNLIITSSYDGQPPDNACKFVEWIESLEDKDLAGVPFAVFGCGNRMYSLPSSFCDWLH